LLSPLPFCGGGLGGGWGLTPFSVCGDYGTAVW
jgi:hypothetical protein